MLVMVMELGRGEVISFPNAVQGQITNISYKLLCMGMC